MKRQIKILMELLFYFIVTLGLLIVSYRIGHMGYVHVGRMKWDDIFSNSHRFILGSILFAIMLYLIRKGLTKKD